MQKTVLEGDFPGGPWLRLHLPVLGVWLLSLVRELRSFMAKNPKHKTEAKF